MSVIIRLQNLPWSANALDIRQYFRGLSIPEGGVHIVGGELGDAFIAFSTDEDARQAFQLNGGLIKEVQIKLLLSSRTEMQKVIEAARNMQTPFAATVPPQPAVIPPVPVVTQEIKRDESRDSKPKDDSKSSASRRSRRRSRSRSRSRERKDRSRDRRDRRRRDRSRSRDRRDRRRDRKERSKSRERARSKEHDRRSRDKRRDSRSDDGKSDMSNPVIPSKPELNEPPKLNPNRWDPENNTGHLPIGGAPTPHPTPSLLGNYPGSVNTSLEDARRSLGLVTGLQTALPAQQPNMINAHNDFSSSFPRNDVLKRETWPPNNKPRFQDRNTLPEKQGMGNMYQSNQNRSMMGQNDNNFGGRTAPNMYGQNNMGLRMHYNQDMGNNVNRPYMNRSGGAMPEFNRGMQQDYPYNSRKDIKEDPYRKDPYMNRKDCGKVESCIQLRPYFGGYGDVRRFFHGLHISNSGIKFATDSQGKRNGTIYVKFVRPDARPQALMKTGHSLRGIIVEVKPLSDEEFDKCGMHDNESDDDKEASKDKEEQAFANKAPFSCLVVEDIPSFSKEHDILKMFSDYSLLGIHILTNNRRRMAYVQFNKEDDAVKALGEKNKHFLGGKPVSVRPCNDKEFAEARSEQEEIMNPAEVQEPSDMDLEDQNEQMDPYSDNAASFDTDVIFLTGMPFKTTDRDVIDFFSDIGLVPTRIHMLLNKFSGPSGECYCEFTSPDEAVAALDKNGMPLGTGIVTVEPFPRWEMEKNLGLTCGVPPANPSHNRLLGRLGPRPGIMGPRPLLPPTNMMRHPPNPMSRYDDGAPTTMGAPGCVLSMENVPFKAGIDEILGFFENFEVSNHNVLRRYNDNGTPTGDARVTFSSPNEARRAFEECRFKKIRDRTIYLRIL